MFKPEGRRMQRVSESRLINICETEHCRCIFLIYLQDLLATARYNCSNPKTIMWRSISDWMDNNGNLIIVSSWRGGKGAWLVAVMFLSVPGGAKSVYLRQLSCHLSLDWTFSRRQERLTFSTCCVTEWLCTSLWLNNVRTNARICTD